MISWNGNTKPELFTVVFLGRLPPAIPVSVALLGAFGGGLSGWIGCHPGGGGALADAGGWP